MSPHRKVVLNSSITSCASFLGMLNLLRHYFEIFAMNSHPLEGNIDITRIFVSSVGNLLLGSIFMTVSTHKDPKKSISYLLLLLYHESSSSSNNTSSSSEGTSCLLLTEKFSWILRSHHMRIFLACWIYWVVIHYFEIFAMNTLLKEILTSQETTPYHHKYWFHSFAFSYYKKMSATMEREGEDEPNKQKTNCMSYSFLAGAKDETRSLARSEKNCCCYDAASCGGVPPPNQGSHGNWFTNDAVALRTYLHEESRIDMAAGLIRKSCVSSVLFFC